MAIIKLTRSKHRKYYSRLASDNGESARESDIRERVINNRERRRENCLTLFSRNGMPRDVFTDWQSRRLRRAEGAGRTGREMHKTRLAYTSSSRGFTPGLTRVYS